MAASPDRRTPARLGTAVEKEDVEELIKLALELVEESESDKNYYALGRHLVALEASNNEFQNGIIAKQITSEVILPVMEGLELPVDTIETLTNVREFEKVKVFVETRIQISKR